MMYEKYYGFNDKPFQVAPNPKYLYLSSKHQNALTHLEYGITEGDGFILLTGEIGTGKTLLIKKLLSGITSNLEVAVIFSTNLNAGNLVNLVLNEFEIPGRFQDKAYALDALFQFLVAKFNENKRVILIIDEAQNLPVDALEEVRMMSNIQSDTNSLIQIVLVGQPELKKILATPALAALTQRIAWHYHLGPLSRAETAQYIAYRLRVAGRERELFAVDALDLIYHASGGFPRTINILCESLLVYGFADEVSLIERALVEKVLMDRSAITTPSSPPIEKPSFAPTVTERKVNGVMERISLLEKKISKLSDSTPREAEEKSAEDQIPYNATPQPLPSARTRPSTVTQAAEEKSVEHQIPTSPAPQPPPATRARPSTIAQAVVYAMNNISNLPTPPRPATITKSPREVPPAPYRPLAEEKSLSEVALTPRVPGPRPTTSPAVRLGWLALTLLSVIFTVWLIIRQTNEQPQQPRHTLLMEESPSLPSDKATAPVTSTVSPPTSDVSATADAPAPVNTSTPKTTPMSSTTAPRDENAQPPAKSAEKPAAPSVSAIMDKADPASPPHAYPLSKVAEVLRSQLQLEKLRSQLQLGKKIVIHFGDDSNELQPETLPTLTALADLLSSQPDARVVIQGFTDSSGIEGGIQKFGEFRANMVKSFLVARGIKTDKIETYALDSPRPPLSNDTESGKRSNRRVEIEVILSPVGETSQPLKP